MGDGETDDPVDAADIVDDKSIELYDIWVPWDSHDAVCHVPPVGNFVLVPVIVELNRLLSTHLWVGDQVRSQCQAVYLGQITAAYRGHIPREVGSRGIKRHPGAVVVWVFRGGQNCAVQGNVYFHHVERKVSNEFAGRPGNFFPSGSVRCVYVDPAPLVVVSKEQLEPAASKWLRRLGATAPIHVPKRSSGHGFVVGSVMPTDVEWGFLMVGGTGRERNPQAGVWCDALDVLLKESVERL